METTYTQVQARRREQAVREDRERRQEFILSYVNCNVWCNAYRYDAAGEVVPMSDARRDSLAFTALTELVRHAESFRVAQYAHLADAAERLRDGRRCTLNAAWGDLGHMLALSAAGHGAGYFDAGLGDLGDTLQAAARDHGEQMLVRADDGMLETL